MPFESLVK